MHIGDMAMRFRSVTLRNVIGEKSSAIESLLGCVNGPSRR
jgi:hypothetical protein